jgi:CRP-like cAMP-binding protein
MTKVLDNLEILKNVFIFSGLSLEDMKEIQSLSGEEKFKKGQTIFMEGDPPQWVLLLIKGRVKLFKESQGGKETIFQIVGAGETFGELVIFDGRPYSYSAESLEPATIMKIPRRSFLEIIRRRPSMCFEIVLELSRQLRDAQETIQALSVERVEKRVVNLLLKLSERIGQNEKGKMRIPVALTRQNIADMVGSTVETTIRVISRLTREGYLETKGKTIYILDVKGLKSAPGDFL